MRVKDALVHADGCVHTDDEYHQAMEEMHKWKTMVDMWSIIEEEIMTTGYSDSLYELTVKSTTLKEQKHAT
jgi:hypothetical protein